MAFYLLLMAGCVVAGRCFEIESSPGKRKRFSIVLTVLFILLAALRSESIGSDTPQYCFVYPRIAANPLLFSFQHERYEAGFIIFCKLLGFISPEPRFLLVVTSIIIFSAIGYTIYKNSCDVAMSFALMLALSLFSFFVSIMRQSIAMAIIMVAVEVFLKKKKRIPFALCVLGAATFHTSAFAAIMMLLPTLRRFDMPALCACLLTGIVGTILSRPLFRLVVAFYSKYADYMNTSYFAPNVLGAIAQCLICGGILALSLIYTPIRKRGGNEYAGSSYILSKPPAEPLSDRMNLFLWFASIDLLLTMMCSQLVIYDRLRYYYECYTICLLPWALQQEKQQSTRFIMQALVFAAAAAYFVAINVFRPLWGSIIPYEFFF